MGLGYNFTETLRTALICATIAFLGYLGYTIIQARSAGGAVAGTGAGSELLDGMQSKLEALDRGVAAIRQERAQARRPSPDAERESIEQVRAGLDARILELEKRADTLGVRIQSLQEQRNVFPEGTTIEYGAIEFSAPEDYQRTDDGGGCQRIDFDNTYAAPPAVFTSQVDRTEVGDQRHWVQAVAENVTTTGCLACITVRPENRDYGYRIAYIVIGQVAE